MKRHFLLLFSILLFTLISSAYAEIELPLSFTPMDEEGQDVRTGELIVWQDQLYNYLGIDEMYRIDVQTGQAIHVPVTLTPHAPKEISTELNRVLESDTDGLYKAEAQWMLGWAEKPDIIFANGDIILGFNIYSGIVYSYASDPANNGLICSPMVALEWDGLCCSLDLEETTSFSGYVLRENTLYLALDHTARNENDSWQRIIAFDLTTGKGETLATKVAYLTDYDDETLLWIDTANVLHIMEDNGTELQSMMIEKTKELAAVRYDPGTQQYFCLMSFSPHLYTTKNFITFTLHYYCPPSSFYSPETLLLYQGQSILFRSFSYDPYVNKIQLSPFTPVETREPLRIIGNDSGNDGFRAAHSNIPVENMPSLYGLGMKYVNDMMRKNDYYDIYVIDLDSHFAALKEKGFFYDLLTIDAIKEQAPLFYNEMSELPMDSNGRLAAYPLSIHQNGFGYSQWALSQLNLEADDMPKTLDELVDFLLAWEEHPSGIRPYRETDEMMRLTLLNIVTSSYQSYYLTDPQGANAISTQVANLLDKINQMDPTLTGNAPSMFSIGQGRVYDTQPDYLFTANACVVPGSQTFNGMECVVDFAFMPLPLCDGAPLVIPITAIEAYVVNPYSTKLEEARTYLGYIAENASPSQMAKFFQGEWLEESEYYLSKVNLLGSQLEVLEIRLNAAPEEMRKDIEVEMNDLNTQLAQYEASRYAVTPEMVQSYASYLPLFDLNGLLAPELDTHALYIRLRERQLDGKEYLDSITELMDKVHREAK